jgi:protein TonB
MSAGTESPMSRHFAAANNASPAPRWASVGVVAALHGLALWGLWQTEFRSSMAEAGTLFVTLLEQRQPAPEPPKPLVPVKLKRPEPARPASDYVAPQIVAAAPVTAPTDYVAPPPPAIVAAPVPAAAPAAPPQRVSLAELAVTCPERTAPAYPPFARRRGEQGQVVLRVFLDEQGRVTNAVVNQSSGSPQLDEAALQAVRRWQCRPATRDGQAAPAVALQPFNFVLDRT